MDQPERVTFFMMAYNQEKLVEASVRSALAQDYENLEVILSDDCSSDRTFEIMQAIVAEYDGRHDVKLNRNPQNLGIGQHVNLMFEMAQGVLIVIQAGDDISVPERTRRLYEAFTEGDEAGRRRPMIVFSDMLKMDMSGTLGAYKGNNRRMENMGLQRMATTPHAAFGAVAAYHPDVYWRIGPLSVPGIYEDRVLTFRAILLGRVHHLPEALVHYREGGISNLHHTAVGGGSEGLRAKRRVVLWSDTHQKLLDAKAYAPRRLRIHKLLEQKITVLEAQISEDIVAGLIAENVLDRLHAE